MALSTYLHFVFGSRVRQQRHCYWWLRESRQPLAESRNVGSEKGDDAGLTMLTDDARQTLQVPQAATELKSSRGWPHVWDAIAQS
jgi:hypothetical protein